jgi:integrase
MSHLNLVMAGTLSGGRVDSSLSADAVALQDHRFLLEGYLQSHRIRNHSPKTIARERSFLEGWFASHGSGERPLLTWEAMARITGRKLMTDYGNALIESGVSSDTARAYLGTLSRYFSYVLEHPHVHSASGVRHILSLYGPLDQPISEYDMPQHVYDGERLGVPMDPDRLYEFYALLRKQYLGAQGGCRAIRARNYTAAVVAGESGMRADELIHLEISRDLFFEGKKLQTRFAKGTHGSGKRARLTLFPPLARDTVQFYLKEHRPNIRGARQTDFLFPSKTGRLLAYSSLHEGLAEMLGVVRVGGLNVAPHMSWHWFRRIFATRFIERFPQRLAVLINLLGHMSPNTVHRYIRHSEAWMDGQMQEVLEGTEGQAWPSTGD